MIDTEFDQETSLVRPVGATRLRVRVPASTANLGPGLDCFGMALELYNEVLIDLTAEPGVRHVGRDAELLARQENLVETAMQVFERATGFRVPAHGRTQTNAIPTTRGLGSSAAAIVAGLVVANQLADEPLGLADLLQLAGDMEGHADNVGAALYGGLVVSYVDRGRYYAIPVPLADELTSVVYLPDALLPTEEARAALPERPPLADAIHNLGRSALLTVAMQQGRYEYLRDAMVDRLHQPYREGMVPGMNRLIADAVAAGAYGACLSGAGPSVIALSSPEAAPAVAEALCATAGELDCAGEAMILPICHDGAQVAWSR